MAATTSYRLRAAGHESRVSRVEARAWLPDVASVAAVLTFFYVLFVFNGPTRLFHDSDAGWHIRSGEQILRTVELPARDPYSFSRPAAPWMNWEWLSDVTTASAHRAAGLGGVALLFSAAIAVVTWLWFRLHWKLETNFLLACALAVPLLGTVNLHWLARPHVFSWLLMLAALLWAEQGPSRHGLVSYAALAALWANVHGSFLFAPLLAFLYGGASLLRPLIWSMDRSAEHKRARYFFGAGCAAALASLLNPYGWQLHRHVLAYLGNRDLLASVGEFQSFNFHAAGAGEIILALAVAAAGTMAALARRRIDHFLLGVALLGLALQSARGLPLVALLLLPIAGSHLSALWKSAAGSSALRPGLRGWLEKAFAYGEQLRAVERRAASPVWVVPALAAACILAAPLVSARAGFPSAEFPVSAAARLEQLAPELFSGQGRLLAPDKFGGYLIYHFDGRLKVFFDGRSDFYGAEFLNNYRRLVQVRPGWQQGLERFGFTHALLPNDYSLVDALERSGWSVLYRDGAATLLKRPGGLEAGR